MKKRMLYCFLTVAILMMMVVFAVNADSHTEQDPSTVAAQIRQQAALIDFEESTKQFCPVCGEVKDWIALDPEWGKRPIPGNHYYLSADVRFTQSADAAVITPLDGSLCLHLNGKKLEATGSSRALFVDEGTLNIMGTGTVSGNYSYGATLYVRNGGELNLYGGTYVAKSGNQNAVLRLNAGTLNIYDGVTISGAGVEQSSLYVGSASAVLNMYGGTAQSVYVTGGNLHFAGGKVENGVNITSASANVKLSGAPVISGSGLILPKGELLQFGELSKAADITIFANGPFSAAAAVGYADCFKPANAGDVIASDGVLRYITATMPSGYCPVCDKTVTWKKLTATSAVALANGDHYYLEDHVSYTGTTAEGFLTAPASGKACVHLNGKNLTSATRVLEGGAGAVAIMGEGTVSGNKTVYGATIRPKGGGKVHLYGGTYTKATDNDQAVIYAWSSEVRLYGVEVVGGAGISALCHLDSSSATVHFHNGSSITGGRNSQGYGGNVRVGTGKFYMYGGHISGGSAVLGNDMYVEAGKFIMTGGVIDGEIVVKDAAAPTVELSGSAKITGKGLVLPAGKLPILGVFNDDASVAVKANGAFTDGNGATYLPYFKAGGENGWIEEHDGVLSCFSNDTLTNKTSGTVTAWCPVCKANKEWVPISTTLEQGAYYPKNGHYYLAENVTVSNSDGAIITSADNTNSCVHLNGKNVTSSSNRAIYTLYGTLNILGNGTVSGKGTYGATLYVKSTLNLYGGIYTVATGATSNLMIENAGATVNVYTGATIKGVEATSSSLLIKGTFNMYGGLIKDGRKSSGNGGIMHIAGGVVTLYGGRVTGGFAGGNGGNVYIEKGSLTVKAGASVDGGKAATKGGNVYLNGETTANVALDLYGSITGGEAGKGGNISAYGEKATVNLYEGALISGGKGTDTANDSDDTWTVGNILINHAVLNMYGGKVKDGISTKASKNIMISYGKMNMSGGVVYGNAKESSAATGSAVRLHGSAGVLTMSGDAKIIREDGKYLSVIRLHGSRIVIEAGWTGQASVRWAATADCTYGTALPSTRASSTGAYTGTLIYESGEDIPIFRSSSGSMELGAMKLVDGDAVTWHADILTAHKNAPNSYIQLMADATLEIPAGETACVDLAGKNLTATGAGTIYGMNTRNRVDGVFNADASGKLITTTVIAEPAYTAEGIYVPLKEADENTTFHLLDMRLTHMSLNTARSALYYNAQYLCDEKLAAKVTDYGISYSVLNMPEYGCDHGIDASAQSVNNGKFLQTDVPFLVGNVLKTGENNAERGKEPVYANPYIKLGDTVIMADITTGDTVADEGFDGIGKSLYDLIAYQDKPAVYYDLSDNQRAIIDQYYLKWEAELKSWDLRCLGGVRDTTPLSDGKTLKFLSISSSFGLNTTQLLYDIAKAQGAENVVIGRLYASGCSLERHVANSKENIAWYEYTKNVDGKWVKHHDATMQYGLQDEQWDIIFIQNGAAQTGQVSTYGDYIDQWVGYIRETALNPKVRLVWNMTWAYDQNTTQSVFEYFNSDQMTMYNTILDVMKEKIVPRNDFSALIPSGTAIQNARTYYGDTLTADTYHLNNLGKAIAGYTLYCTLTGQKLTEVHLNKADGQDSIPVVNLTEMDKKVILESVNNAIRNPFQVTPTTYK